MDRIDKPVRWMEHSFGLGMGVVVGPDMAVDSNGSLECVAEPASDSAFGYRNENKKQHILKIRSALVFFLGYQIG